MDHPEKLAAYDIQDEEKTKQKHNAICVEHHYAQANTNNVNKTWALLQTTSGKDEPKINIDIVIILDDIWSDIHDYGRNTYFSCDLSEYWILPSRVLYWLK